MPELCRFNGIIIYLRFNDTQQHNKPHIHAIYGDFEAAIGIDGELLAGSMPQKQYNSIVAWLNKNEEQAYAAWNNAVQSKHFDKIAP